MTVWAKQYGIVFMAGLTAMTMALAYSLMGTGALFSGHPFIVVLRWGGLGMMAAGMAMFTAMRREEADNQSLTPLFGFLTIGSVLLILVALFTTRWDFAEPAAIGGVGLAVLAMLIALVAAFVSPAMPEPFAKSWPAKTVLTKFALEDDAHHHSDHAEDHHDAAEDEVTGHEAVVPDKLTKIEGIGPKLQEIFQAAGIMTFAQLADYSPEKLREIVEAAAFKAPFDTTSWPSQARMAAEGNWDMLEVLQAGLTGGRTKK